MKLFLSSYKFGNDPQKLSDLFIENKRVGFIMNALDFSTEFERMTLAEKEQFDQMFTLGLKPERLDLRNYFGKKSELESKLNELGGLWVYGGNTFVLRMAYKLSGFDEILTSKLKFSKDFVYGGFSAGVCVLQESLKGIEFTDDPNMVKTTYGVEPIWEGVGILDYVFVPHFESDHPESESANTEIAYYKANNINYKPLQDGEFIINET